MLRRAASLGILARACAAALALASVAACGDDAVAPATPVGAFELTHIGDDPLPAFANRSPSSGGPLWVTAGSLTLDADGGFLLEVESALAEGEPSASSTHGGTFARESDGTLVFDFDGTGTTGTEPPRGEVLSDAIVVEHLWGEGSARFAR